MISKIKKIGFFVALACVLFGVFVARQLYWHGAFLRPIVVMGDSQHFPQVHKKIVAAAVRERPIAVFQLGDQVEDGHSHLQWEVFNEITYAMRRVAKYYPALGNHEANSPLYFENFKLPNNERWYAVKENNILFIILDSESAFSADSQQYRWFRDTLKKHSPLASFIIVNFHRPLFTSSSVHHEDEMGWRNEILPLLEQYRVNAVFSGHCHNYERCLYKGIYFIVSGGAGSRLYDKTRNSPYSQKFIKQFHYCRLDNSGDRVLVSVIDINGDLIDEFELKSRL